MNSIFTLPPLKVQEKSSATFNKYSINNLQDIIEQARQPADIFFTPNMDLIPVVIGNENIICSTLFIKNMVSLRCKLLVSEVLKSLEIYNVRVELGKVEISESLSTHQLMQLQLEIQKWGLEVMCDKKLIIIEQIKATIIEMIHFTEDSLKMKNSIYLSNKLKYSYTYLANIFSKSEGTTIEQFIIKHKIERVKGLLLYEHLTLSEIAWKVHYSSESHLTNQFKKITGLTPSQFKKSEERNLFNLEDV